MRGCARRYRASAQAPLISNSFQTWLGGGAVLARARPSSARQSILLITEMIFDYLIAIISLKAAEIGVSEVAKKSTLLPPSQSTSERQITQRAKHCSQEMNVQLKFIHFFNLSIWVPMMAATLVS